MFGASCSGGRLVDVWKPVRVDVRLSIPQERVLDPVEPEAGQDLLSRLAWCGLQARDSVMECWVLKRIAR